MQEQLGALGQPIAQIRMLPVSGSFLQGFDTEMLGRSAAPKCFELRKDEPHPVSSLFAKRQFSAHRIVYLVLRCYETL